MLPIEHKNLNPQTRVPPMKVHKPFLRFKGIAAVAAMLSVPA